jgi:hypothetical protein
MTTGKWDHLNRPLGYEIASLLINSALSFSEIKRRLPYENVRDSEVNRILSGQAPGPEIFTVPKTRGGVKHTLNTQLFSDEELERIRNRAQARIHDNQSETEQVESSRDRQPPPHIDAPNMTSRFS